MHPALRKGPLFTKNPSIFHFFHKKHFPLKKHPPHFISCLRACLQTSWSRLPAYIHADAVNARSSAELVRSAVDALDAVTKTLPDPVHDRLVHARLSDDGGGDTARDRVGTVRPSLSEEERQRRRPEEPRRRSVTSSRRHGNPDAL